MPFDENDPVVASYNVYMSSSKAEEAKERPKFYVLQYSSHRPSTKPYNSSRAQKPAALRIKPNTSIFEVDVPIITSDNYNNNLGAQLGQAMGNVGAHTNPSFGLSGGFSTNHTSQQVNLNDVPVHGEDDHLKTQTLGGKAATSSDKDPVYMLATMQNDAIYLTHLDAVVQMRPQLHHLDAAEEAKRKAEVATKAKPLAEGVPTKLETRAIEVKIKDSRDDSRDHGLKDNAELLRDIQGEKWIKHEWIDQDDASDTKHRATQHTINRERILKSALDNDEWLDKMSSPGIELRIRLKGRDRERARRKRQERQRAQRIGATNTAVGIDEAAVQDSGSAEEDEEEDEESAAEEVGPSTTNPPVAPVSTKPAPIPTPPSPEIKIKKEVSVPDAPTSPPSTRKRGRPRKT